MDHAIGTKIHAALIHSTNAKWPLRSPVGFVFLADVKTPSDTMDVL